MIERNAPELVSNFYHHLNCKLVNLRRERNLLICNWFRMPLKTTIEKKKLENSIEVLNNGMAQVTTTKQMFSSFVKSLSKRA